MKHFALRIMLFLCFAAVVYVIMLTFFGTWVPKGLRSNLPYSLGGYGFLNTRLKEADTTTKVDILFIGSSHSYRGYDTRIFEAQSFKVFNLGSSSQTPVQTEILVNRYLDKLRPKFVILDIYPILFNADGAESTVDLLSNARIDNKLLKEALKIPSIKVYNTLLYSLIKKKLGLNQNFIESKVFKDDKYIRGGYVENFRIYNVKKIYSSFTYKINDKQYTAFLNILNLLNKKKISFIVVQSPISQTRYNSITNNSEIDSIIQQQCIYLNFNELYKWNDSLFSDDNHLNQYGVTRFNGLLLNQEIFKKVSISQINRSRN